MNHKKSASELIAGVLMVAFIVGAGLLYHGFFKNYIASLTSSIEEGKEYHGYSVEECAKFQPELIAVSIRSNLSYEGTLKVSSTPDKEMITENGKPVAKANNVVISVWTSSNDTWYSLYDDAGRLVKGTTKLLDNSSLASVIPLNNNFTIIAQYFNGTNFDLVLSVVDNKGDVVASRRLTFDENNERVPDIATNGNEIAIAYVKTSYSSQNNGSTDIRVMRLDKNLNILSDVAITSDYNMDYNPSITYFNGAYYIAYEKWGYTNYSTIQLSKYEPGVGVSLIGNVTSITTGVFMPSITSSPDYLFIAYEVKVGNINQIYYSAYNTSMSEIKKDVPALSSFYDQKNPSATYGAGKFVIVWTEKDSTYGSLTKGVRLSDIDFSTLDTLNILIPKNVYSSGITYGDGTFAILSAGENTGSWDLFLKYISDKRFLVILQNPSPLNITITDYRIFFKDGGFCHLRGTNSYIEPHSSEQYIAYDCDTSKSCEDIKEIRLGTECGLRTFSPKC